ncbi:MAG: hypothetical protein ACREGB_04140, partial [Candidatus Saccharimonadales bacterium]
MSGAEKNEISHTDPRASKALGALASAATVSAEVMPRPKPNLYLAVGNAPRDHRNHVIPNEQQRGEIIRALAEFDGITPANAYNETDVVHGVEQARQLAESGESTKFLSQLRMIVNRYDLPSYDKPLKIDMQGELAIDPRRIVGVGSLRNWQGVAHDSDGRIIRKQEATDSSGVSKPSHVLIDDYATRDTRLPAAIGVDLFLTSHGAFAFSHDSHRVAAAQLRHEPVQIDEMTLFDY